MKKFVLIAIPLILLAIAVLVFYPFKKNIFNSPSVENYVPFEKNKATINQAVSTDRNSCLSASHLSLPYQQKHNSETIRFEQASCQLTHVEEFICADEKLRYIPLPKFKDIEVILIPVNCGDFSYRYLLATVKANNKIDSVYVEGEWFEPGNEEATREFTEFSLAQDYLITIKSHSQPDAKPVTTTKHYRIDAQGKLQEQGQI